MHNGRRLTQRNTPGLFDSAEMLAWIRHIVAFGIRRPGYPQSLKVEQWLEEIFGEFGLSNVRREPVPVNYWQPSVTSLTIEGALRVPCFPVPYTAWTSAAGLEAPLAFLAQGALDDFQSVPVKGRVAVIEMRFGEITGSGLKASSLFVRDRHQSIPDGTLHVANWLIRNFDAYYEAQKRGAIAVVGLLMDSPTNGSEFYVPYDGHLKGVPAVWVGREHAQQVREAARRGQFVRLVSTGNNRVVNSHNVVATIPGAGGGESDLNENIILTCHHDAPFASAVEDASGLTVLLSLAKKFASTEKQLKRDLVFVASSGHFHGGIGNRIFVEKHSEGLLQYSVAAFGVEHIAEEVEGDGSGDYNLTGRPEVRALFFDGSRKFARVLEEEADWDQLDRLICADAYSFGPEPPCDSAPFFTAGIPSACHISGPLYLFDPRDTVDKVRVKDLEPVARFFANTIRRVDSLSAAELCHGMKRPRGSPAAPLPSWFRPPPQI